MSLRTQFFRRCENIHALLSTQLLDQYAKCHEHGTPIWSVAAMHSEWAARLGVVRQCLVHQFYETACHLRYFTLHRRPAVILILFHDRVLVSLRVQNAKFATRVIRTTFAVDVTDSYMIIISLIVRPVAWTFPRAFVQLEKILFILYVIIIFILIIEFFFLKVRILLFHYEDRGPWHFFHPIIKFQILYSIMK